MVQLTSQVPKAFISYSWDNESHKSWVRDLATRLRLEGIDVVLDQWDAIPGDQLPAFMEKAIRDIDFVLIICTPNYKMKANNRIGGVGYEGDIMTAEVFKSQNQRKFIPILRDGDWASSVPTWLTGKYGIDLLGEPYSQEKYDDLLVTLHGVRHQAPPLGSIPERLSKPATKSEINENTVSNAIKIKGIVIDEVSAPRNDGTKGSALYKIPFQLSQRPSTEWSAIFVKTWDHPPRFTTMHRPGIASISGDKIILNGTTIDEVEKYHRDTLQLVIQRVNEIISEQEAKKINLAQVEAKKREQHEAEIREKASRLNFE